MRTRRSRFSGNQVQSPLAQAGAEGHLPVLLHEVISGLAIQPNDVVVDATLGGAGHAQLIAESLSEKGVLFGIDADHDAVERGRIALANVAPKVIVVEGNFRDLDTHLRSHGTERIDKALFDLGWSSYQLEASRGFSFQKEGPLTMTYAKNGSQTAVSAGVIVNEWAEESIADIIFGWGEERYSRRIAKAIVEERARKSFTTTKELADVIYSAVPSVYRHGRIHPATRTFQALRIAVNDELGALTQGLNAAWDILASGGRIAVISFHSIEDRIVKRIFKDWEDAGEGIRITRKPQTASLDEIARNPRARSAKLRIMQKN